MGGKGVKEQIINSFGPLGKERVEKLRVGGSRDKLEDAVIEEHPPLRSQGREGSNGDAARGSPGGGTEDEGEGRALRQIPEHSIGDCLTTVTQQLTAQLRGEGTPWLLVSGDPIYSRPRVVGAGQLPL